MKIAFQFGFWSAFTLCVNVIVQQRKHRVRRTRSKFSNNNNRLPLPVQVYEHYN